MSRGCFTRDILLLCKSAWMWDSCRYHIVLFHYIVSRLAMWHSRLFRHGIFEIPIGARFIPRLTRGIYFYVKGAWMWDCCLFHVVLFHCIVSLSVMFHSRLFRLGIFQIPNRCEDVRLLSIYHVVSVLFHKIVSCLEMFHAWRTRKDILGRVNPVGNPQDSEPEKATVEHL